MPLQNRVDPWGALFADTSRGTFMGNRGGVLHDDAQRIVRDQRSRAWIICLTDFKGRRRPVMQPGLYTELFFLDEATALAAGHRPCFECRRPDARHFLELWRRSAGADAPVKDLDAALSEERRVPRAPLGTGKRVHRDRLGSLPDGAMVEVDGDAWLVHRDRLHRWTSTGYDGDTAIAPDRLVWVLTPPTTLRVLANGYRPSLHPDLATTHDDGDVMAGLPD